MNEKEITRTLNAISSDGESFKIHCQISTPFIDENNFSSVTLKISPLIKNTETVSGSDSWQAVTIAMGSCGKTIRKFIENGGKVYFENDEEELTAEYIESIF